MSCPRRQHYSKSLLSLTPILSFLVLGLCFTAPVLGQGAPGTDIWVLDLREAAGGVQLGDAARITDRAGYDNQPHFGPGGAYLLYTSMDDAGQTDIHRYDFSARRSENLTGTAPESEYSATMMPGGERFSVIRVEADSSQRLWSFGVEGSDPQVVLHSIMPVGYHAWIDTRTLALFVLGSPATLQIANTGTQVAEIAAENIGRSIHKVPQHRLASFLQWEGSGQERVGTIKTIDPNSGGMEVVGEALAGSEDYAWTHGGVILMGSGSKLFSLTPGDSAGWQELVDLEAVGVQGITRLAVSPDGGRLAVVANR